MWPVWILQGSVGELQVLTAQDASDLQGALVCDCRPPLLPVSLWLEGHWGVAFTSDGCFGQPGCASPGGLYGDRWCEPGRGSCSGALVSHHWWTLSWKTNCQRLRIRRCFVIPARREPRPPGVRSATREIVDLELEKALLSAAILPEMVTPLEEPVEGFLVAPSSYPEPPVPVLPSVVPDVSSNAFSTPGVSRWTGARCVSDVLDFAGLFCLRAGHLTGGCCLPATAQFRLQWTNTSPVMVTCSWGMRWPLPELSSAADVSSGGSWDGSRVVRGFPCPGCLLLRPPMWREGPFDIIQDALEVGGHSSGVELFAGVPISHDVIWW